MRDWVLKIGFKVSVERKCCFFFNCFLGKKLSDGKAIGRKGILAMVQIYIM